jgi:hypothetical protein
MQQARGIEAFGKFLRLRPQLAVPVAQASIELMLLQPLGQSGQLPPPPVVDARWKERATARISMAKVGLGWHWWWRQSGRRLAIGGSCNAASPCVGVHPPAKGGRRCGSGGRQD